MREIEGAQLKGLANPVYIGRGNTVLLQTAEHWLNLKEKLSFKNNSLGAQFIHMWCTVYTLYTVIKIYKSNNAQQYNYAIQGLMIRGRSMKINNQETSIVQCVLVRTIKYEKKGVDASVLTQAVTCIFLSSQLIYFDILIQPNHFNAAHIRIRRVFTAKKYIFCPVWETNVVNLLV